MRTEQPKVIYLKDYQAPDYLIDETHLTFELFEDHTLVHAQLVSAEREGRNLHYRPALARMNDLLAYLTDHCCMGQPCAPPGAKRRASC